MLGVRVYLEAFGIRVRAYRRRCAARAISNITFVRLSEEVSRGRVTG